MRVKYEQGIINKIDIIDKALQNIGKPSLFNNDDFFIDTTLEFDHFIRITIKRQNSIEFKFILTNDSFQIDVDRIEEAFEWCNKQISEKQNEIVKFIEMLLTSGVILEYCGSNYTKLQFIDDKGTCVKQLKYISGLYLKIGCTIKTYLPLY